MGKPDNSGDILHLVEDGKGVEGTRGHLEFIRRAVPVEDDVSSILRMSCVWH